MWLISLYLFSTGAIVSSLLVITSTKAINAIISLIIAFINAIGIFMLLGVDFIALIYCIVYVGAIAILFLFVIMLLSDSTNALTVNSQVSALQSTNSEKEHSYGYGKGKHTSPKVSAQTVGKSAKRPVKISEVSPMVVLIGVLYIVEVWCGIAASFVSQKESGLSSTNILTKTSNGNEIVSLLHDKNSINALGEMLFKECGYEVLLAISLILLVGMIGSIILTLRSSSAKLAS